MIKCVDSHNYLYHVVRSVGYGQGYQHTLEYQAGPGSTCDDVRHQGLVNAFYQGNRCWLWQRVIRISPR